ncbi:gastrula zinc finger protein xFG20-1-like [Syngnathoides biaculeatus]|uniref:gastrula zinc finger protein xFG20-1-like n=1 Tax=Syngnathoides biaculeatus TaxID=300417 RepID=UPI002ADD97A8|nr:gastrula zinc finger protein xFG20-1-like [Syngnathoides biaculeatus]
MLRDLVRERLIAAADEIFGLFERTISSYEEQLCRAKEETERHRRQLAAFSKAHTVLRLQDVQLLTGHQVQQLSTQLHLGTTSLEHPQTPHIKVEVEEEDLSTVARKSKEQPHESPHMISETSGHHSGARQEEHIFAPLSDSGDIEELLRSGTDSEDDFVAASSFEHSQRPHVKQEQEAGVSELLLTDALVKKEDDDTSPDWSPPDHHSPGPRMRPHVSTHSGENSFHCSLCGHRFSRKIHLASHMKTHRRVKPFSCLICGEGFSSNVALISHTVTHNVDKYFMCYTCGKNFSCKRNLNEHMQTHTENSFKCSVCDKRFTQKVNLEWHMKTHPEENVFTCSFCGKTFSQESALVAHVQIHKGEKPFACLVCGRRFCLQTNMVSHMKTHMGGKAF